MIFASSRLVKETPKLVRVSPCQQLGCETRAVGILIFALAEDLANSWRPIMFFFFSNTVGVIGSILISLILTLLILYACST